MDPGWVQFHRQDATPIVDLLRTVADAHDAGEHGDGVEVVVESPKPSWLADLFGRADHVQARIIVTKTGGEVAYPVDVQLISDRGGRAARRAGRELVGPGQGWATSNTDGRAYLVRKGRAHDPVDWTTLAGGTMTALGVLAGRVKDKGWRVRVDRAVKRA
ncbi:MAG TPA: hypothetical protein VFC00_11195 [Micromonosporaceae bacterium]|nr:hypothetical protein [Micromonosporaceae bacterium]